MNLDTLKDRITAAMDNFTSSQQVVARFFLLNENALTFKTAGELAEEIGVSASTIVRFARAIGFDNYAQMQKYVQQTYMNGASFAERLSGIHCHGREEALYSSIIRQDSDALLRLLTPDFYSAATKAAALIESAGRIYIAASRGSASIATHLVFNLNYMKPNIISLVSDSGTWCDSMVDCGEGDLIIGICMLGYTKRTMDMVNFAKKRGVSVLAITDSEISPLAAVSDGLLCCGIDCRQAFWSPSIAITICNAVLQKVAQSKEPQIVDRLARMEETIKNSDIYYK